MTTGDTETTGMCVPYSVRQTPDKGRGVFAETDISKGTVIWRHVAGQYEVLDQEKLENLLAAGTREEAVYLLTHILSMGEFPGYMVRVLDAGELINHSAQPNVKRKCSADEYPGADVQSAQDVYRALDDSHFDLVAACDIAAGDEMLMDYDDEPDDPAYYEEACERYGVDWDWV